MVYYSERNEESSHPWPADLSLRSGGHSALSHYPGMTVAFTVPFVGAAVGVVSFWLTAQGMIGGTFAAILSVVVWIGLSFTLHPIYRALLDRLVNRPGCLMGLIFYAVGLFGIAPLFVWQLWPDWINAGLIAVLVVPILSVGAAIIGSRASETGRSRRGARR